jgi:hypothetical protein
VRERIRQWIAADEQVSLTQVHAVLGTSEQELPVHFHLPTRLTQKGSLKTAVIGVEGVDFKNEQQLLSLLVSLVALSETKADYFLLLPVVDGQAKQGLRYSKEIFKWLKALDEGEEADTPSDWQMPQPKVPTTADVQPLVGIEAQVVEEPVENERVLGTLQALWKIWEYRRRLADAPALERAWLDQLKTATRVRVETDLRWLQPRLGEANYLQLAECATRWLDREGSVDEDVLVTLLETLINRSHEEQLK